MRKQTFAVLVSLAVAAFLVGSGARSTLAQQAGGVWSPPTQTPPGGNTPAPLNVGPAAQSKIGALDSLFLRGWTYLLSPDGVDDNAGSGNSRAALIFGGSDSTSTGSGAAGGISNLGWYLGAINNTAALKEQLGVWSFNANTWEQIWSSNGNVGIGSPNVPQTALDVAGQVTIRGGNPQAGYVLTSQDANGTAAWAPAPAGGGIPVPASGSAYVQAYENLGEDEYRAGPPGATQRYAALGAAGLASCDPNQTQEDCVARLLSLPNNISCADLTDATLPSGYLSFGQRGTVVRPVAQQPFVDIKGYDTAPLTPRVYDDFGVLVGWNGQTHSILTSGSGRVQGGQNISIQTIDVPNYPVDMAACYGRIDVLPDTCDGDSNDTLYQCKPDETRTCIDHYRHDGYDALATITCSAKSVIEGTTSVPTSTVNLVTKDVCFGGHSTNCLTPATSLVNIECLPYGGANSAGTACVQWGGGDNGPSLRADQATLNKLCEVSWEPGAKPYDWSAAGWHSPGGHPNVYWDAKNNKWTWEGGGNAYVTAFTCYELK